MIALFLGIIVSFPVYPALEKAFAKGKASFAWMNLKCILALLIFIIALVEIVAGSYNPLAICSSLVKSIQQAILPTMSTRFITRKI